MIDQTFLSRFEGLKETGPGKWQSLCPCHDDHKPSLNIKLDGDRYLLSCPVCNANGSDVCKAAGIPENSMFVNDVGVRGADNPAKAKTVLAEPPTHWQGRPIIKWYDYTSSDGEVLYRVGRTNPKGDFPILGRTAGGWGWGLNGHPRKLYRLKELLQADPGGWVFLVEGEKDCDRLADEGMTATTCSMGAGKWRPEYTETLRDRNVAVVPDNDKPGRKHAREVAQSLTGAAGQVRIVELPDLPDKGDVSSWLDNGGTKGRLLELTEAASIWAPIETKTGEVVEGHIVEPILHDTDLGASERFIAQHRDNIRYCHQWGRWLIWDGIRWKADENNEIVLLAKKTVEKI